MHTVNSEMLIQAYIKRYQMAEFLNDNLLDALEYFEFAPYSHVFVEQERQHYLYFIVEGEVQCSHYHLNGSLAVFAISTPFTSIGDLEILSDERVHSTVIAMKKTIMLGIPRAIVHQFGANDPKFLRFLLDQVREKLYTSNSFQMIQTLPVISRFAVYLLSNMDDEHYITLPDKESVASLLGTSLRHLNRTIKQLTSACIISATYPRLYIMDKTLLKNIAEQT
ncbi:MAG: cyclic nucleotide-binding domain-containing protein [Phototrophicaceae bacterium]